MFVLPFEVCDLGKVVKLLSASVSDLQNGNWLMLRRLNELIHVCKSLGTVSGTWWASASVPNHAVDCIMGSKFCIWWHESQFESWSHSLQDVLQYQLDEGASVSGSRHKSPWKCLSYSRGELKRKDLVQGRGSELRERKSSSCSVSWLQYLKQSL